MKMTTNNLKIYMPRGMYLSSITACAETEELRKLTKEAEALYVEFDGLKVLLRKTKVERARLLPSERQTLSGQQLEAKIETLERARQELKQQINSLIGKIQWLKDKAPSEKLMINFSFNEGWYLIRKITSYPEGFILFSQCEKKSSKYRKATIAQLPTIDWSNGAIYQVFVREGDFETIRFSENGDLLENSYTSEPMTNPTKYSMEFVRREISLDKDFLPQVLARNASHRGYRVMDLLTQIPREQGINLPRHYFNCAITEFVSSENLGFGNLENRKKWLLASCKGNRNWNGFALEGVRDRMIKMLRFELDLQIQGEKNNYPNKAYNELHESRGELPSYLGELVEGLSPEQSRTLDSYYKGKHAKITGGKEFFSQVDALCNDMSALSRNLQRYEAARIIVFAFDYYMKSKRGFNKPSSFAGYFRENKKDLLKHFENSSLCRSDNQTAAALSAASPKTILTTTETLDTFASTRDSDSMEDQISLETQRRKTVKKHKPKRKRSQNKSD
jgi:hypothetical protein